MRRKIVREPAGAVETLSLDERRFRLDVEKHIYERIKDQSERTTQIINWMLGLQTILGSGYAYFRVQLSATSEKNWIGTIEKLNALLRWYPMLGIGLAIFVFLTVLAISREQRSIQSKYSDLFLRAPKLDFIGPFSVLVIGLLIAVAWGMVATFKP